MIRQLVTGERGGSTCCVEGPLAGRWPAEDALDRLISAGVAAVEVVPHVRLDATNAESTLDFVRLLRDAMSRGLRLSWSGSLGVGFPVFLVSHLNPPDRNNASRSDPRVAQWWEHYGYGRFYWRAGPGFVLLKDTRAGRGSARFTLQDPVELEVFSRLSQPTPLRAFDGQDREILQRSTSSAR